VIAIGSVVRVRPPFDDALPGTFVVVGQNPDTGAWQINGPNGETDFDEANLEEVT
jgi:hypothetical protein